MASFRSIISIIDGDVRDDANATLNALGGFGPLTYAVGLSPDGTWPPSHFGSNHGTTTEEEHQRWASLIGGVLPEIEGQWGEDGAPSEVDAIAAFGNGNAYLDCITHTDPAYDTVAHWEAMIALHGLQVCNPPE